MTTNEQNQGPGRPPLDGETKDDRLVIRTQSWRVAGVRKAAKKTGKTFVRYVEDALDQSCRNDGVDMPPTTPTQHKNQRP